MSRFNYILFSSRLARRRAVYSTRVKTSSEDEHEFLRSFDSSLSIVESSIEINQFLLTFFMLVRDSINDDINPSLYRCFDKAFLRLV